MACADEEKNHNDEPKKSELLPQGDEAKQIVEVLAAMYLATRTEDRTDDDATHEHVS